jgi:hypothetical protein
MAGTDVAEMSTSTAALTSHLSPEEENNLSPQLMEPDVLVKVASTAEVSAGHLAVQVVEPEVQFLSVVVL